MCTYALFCKRVREAYTYQDERSTFKICLKICLRAPDLYFPWIYYIRVFGGIYALLEIFARLLHQIFLISSAISHYSFDILWYYIYVSSPFVFLFIFQSDGQLLLFFR